ncbi:MAG TPA: hypothetical protein VN368_02565 [Candidatus Methylomirabilis sp.]|nr:hypothetical protein [Candidatus Methylomirabilis sp.]
MHKNEIDSTRYNTDKAAVLISSCDRYNDLWKPFFTLFFKYWPDCPYPVYLSTNHQIYDHPRVITIPVGDDIDWSEGFRSSLQQIPYKYVIIMMEDFFPIKSADTSGIEKLLSYMEKKRAGCLRLFPCPGPDLPCPDNDKVGEISKGSAYRLSLQAAIWDKEILMGLLCNGESAWELEMKGTERTNRLDMPFLSVIGNSPLPYYCTAVVKGKWVEGALQLCKEENIEVDLKARKKQTVIDRFRYSKFVGRLMSLGR